MWKTTRDLVVRLERLEVSTPVSSSIKTPVLYLDDAVACDHCSVDAKQPTREVTSEWWVALQPNADIRDFGPFEDPGTNHFDPDIASVDLVRLGDAVAQVKKYVDQHLAHHAIEGNPRQTKWFYERARGQYQDAVARETTPTRQTEFKRTHPPAQRFTKTDLAKFINSWDQMPDIVSRGSEKNFREFTMKLAKHGQVDVNESYFHNLVAKAIIFRNATQIVSSLDYPGYRANVVTYAVAKLAHATGQRVDLDAIWRKQSIPPTLVQAIMEIAPVVWEEITNPPRGGNVTEWCKRSACWDRIRDRAIRLPKIATTKADGAPIRTERQEDADSDPVVAAMSRIPAEVWLHLSNWAKQTENLAGFQRALAYGVGRQILRGRSISPKQAKQLEIILAEATRLGFVSRDGEVAV